MQVTLGGRRQAAVTALTYYFLWKVPTCAKLIYLLYARAPFAKQSQDRAGRSSPWSLPCASGPEEGITALHSKGSTPVRGCLASGSLGTDPPFPSPRRARAQEGPTGGQTEHKTRDNFSSASSIRVLHPVQECARWPALAFAGLRWSLFGLGSVHCSCAGSTAAANGSLMPNA